MTTHTNQMSFPTFVTPLQTISVDPSEGPYNVDVVFSFDTTGSMNHVLQSVRDNLQATIGRLFREIEGIRIGLITHGDYCDQEECMMKIDLTKNVEALQTFITLAPKTSGGDRDECYEFVLQTAVDFDWKAQVKVLVVIGDARPHQRGYEMPTKLEGFTDYLHIDWNEQVTRLVEKHITVFSCHALPHLNQNALFFYHTISKATGGYYFPLDALQSFQTYMVAICMKAADGADALELLQQNQRELEEKLKTCLPSEELLELSSEVSAISEAITTAKREGVFAPMVRQTTDELLKKRQISTRLQRLEYELQNTTPKFFDNPSSQEFLDILGDRLSNAGDRLNNAEDRLNNAEEFDDKEFEDKEFDKPLPFCFGTIKRLRTNTDPSLNVI